MRPLADNGTYVLAEDGARLLFFTRSGLVPAWALFVVGLLTLAPGGVALAFLKLVVQTGEGAGAVLVLAVLATLFGLLLRVLWRSRAAALARPLDPAAAIVVLDRDRGLLLDGRGATLAPLAQVRFARAFQVTSSARALEVRWPGGSRIVYRGDPFAGAIDAPIARLRSHGFPCP